MRKAFQNGFRLWSRHLGESFDYAIVMLCIALMPAVPLLFLASKELQGLAVLSVLFFVFIALPVRSNAGVVLRDVCHDHDSMNSAGLVFGGRYAKALLRGLRAMLALLIWALPGIAATVYVYTLYKGGEGVDVATLSNKILIPLGGGDLMKGIERFALIYLASWLPLLVGSMVHSGSRHVYAAGKKVLKHRRFGYYITWVLSLAVFLPFVLAVVLSLRGITAPLTAEVGSLKAAVMAIFTGAMKVDVGALVSGFGWKVLAAFVVLFLPAVPLRHLILASYAHAEGEH